MWTGSFYIERQNLIQYTKREKWSNIHRNYCVTNKIKLGFYFKGYFNIKYEEKGEIIERTRE